MTPLQNLYEGYLVLPRIKVQNANCISAPLTWGFPSLTGFAGLMVALERRVGADKGIQFKKFGVVCHAFQPLVNKVGYLTRFNLTRNPLNEHGETSAINEEGRAHMEITLMFKVIYDGERYAGEESRKTLASEIMEIVAGMRISGGTVLHSEPQRGKKKQPELFYVDDTWAKKWKRLRFELFLPGFALVSAHQVLQNRMLAIKSKAGDTALLDAWLHESRSNISPQRQDAETPKESKAERVEWKVVKDSGWVVPIPIGYSPVAPIQDAGSVANARDKAIPFQFVEAIYSLGEWVGPHRLKRADAMLWQVNAPDKTGRYLLSNQYVRATI